MGLLGSGPGARAVAHLLHFINWYLLLGRVLLLLLYRALLLFFLLLLFRFHLQIITLAGCSLHSCQKALLLSSSISRLSFPPFLSLFFFFSPPLFSLHPSRTHSLSTTFHGARPFFRFLIIFAVREYPLLLSLIFYHYFFFFCQKKNISIKVQTEIYRLGLSFVFFLGFFFTVILPISASAS